MLNPLQAIIQRHVEHIQQGIAQALEELSATVLDAEAGDGAVVARVSGLGQLLDVQIADHVLQPGNADAVSGMVTQAVQEAMEKARQLKRDRITQCTPLASMGVELPPDIL